MQRRSASETPDENSAIENAGTEPIDPTRPPIRRPESATTARAGPTRERDGGHRLAVICSLLLSQSWPSFFAAYGAVETLRPATVRHSAECVLARLCDVKTASSSEQ